MNFFTKMVSKYEKYILKNKKTKIYNINIIV